MDVKFGGRARSYPSDKFNPAKRCQALWGCLLATLCGSSALLEWSCARDETDVDCGGSCEPCPGDDGGTCDGTGDCNACTTCAQNDPCANETNACSANPDCVNLLNCVYTCADQQCITDCYATYPAGDPDFTNYDSCVTCSACYNDCGGVNFCP